jgi:hypothetical protein
VPLKELGPEVADELKRLGKRAKVLGYPISLHFFRHAALPKTSSIRCVLELNDKEAVQGFVHVADGGRCRRSSAPGLVVFYPFRPLKRGSAYTVEWSFEQGGERRTLQKYQFWTK